MTKEEALNRAIELEFGDGNAKSIREHNSSLVKVAEHLYDLMQPSLPSNLDEAAEKEIERFCSDMLNVDIIWARMPLTKRFGLQMAKFGAEWMAGQGYSREVEVKEDAGGYPYIDKHFELYDYDKDEPLFKAGDKVVVQIRKK